MTATQFETRQERAQQGVLIASRVDDGFRVYSTDSPSKQYLVTWNGERLKCTCLDFEAHKSDPAWRCKHILAVEPGDHANLEELPEPAEDVTEQVRTAASPVPITSAAPSAEPPNNGSPRRRRAPAKDMPAPIYMVIKRSVSPDGRIDSVSVEFSMPVVDLPIGEIKDKAVTTLQLQRDIVGAFLKLNGHSAAQPQTAAAPQTASAQPKAAGPTPITGNGNGDGSVYAKMLDVGKVNGKWGDRLCIVFDMNGSRTRLFGSAKQLVEHIEAAGYRVRQEEIAPGYRLNIPCRVTTKPSDDGKYLNIERVFAVEPQPANGGSNGRRVN